MDCNLVDINWLSEAFGQARIWNFNIKQQMAPQYFPIWREGEISNWLLIEIKTKNIHHLEEALKYTLSLDPYCK